MSVVVVGLGQLGRHFGAGLLTAGHTVVPVRRGEPLPAMVPDHVLVAVGEDDLGPVLASLPAAWRDRVVLLQNELSPADWLAHGVVRPTVLVVWAEKKKGKPVVNVRPTEVAGPAAALFVAALGAVDVTAVTIDEGRALEDALVVKNLYILVSNLAGLAGAASVGQLLGVHAELARPIAAEILAVEAARLGRTLDASLLDRMREAFAADPGHACRGRTAEARLGRTLARARALGVPTPTLDRLARRDEMTERD